jgi:glycolate oxidase FAD binding subunit
LSGSEKSILAAQQAMGGETVVDADNFWSSIKEQTHNDLPLWRVSLASNTPDLFLVGETTGQSGLN